MHWLYLITAILFEVLGTTTLKMSAGFSKALPTGIMVISYIVCFTFLGLALKAMDVSVAYAIWCGLGIALVFLIGVLFFAEPVNAVKIVSAVLVVAGVIGLTLTTSH